MEEDATVYEYDSIYDEMQQKKKESNARLLSGGDDNKVGTLLHLNARCMSAVCVPGVTVTNKLLS